MQDAEKALGVLHSDGQRFSTALDGSPPPAFDGTGVLARYPCWEGAHGGTMVQGYLAHEKLPPPGNLQKHAYGRMVDLGGGGFL